jgi:Gpi18-like mannosyltransferase
MCKKPFRFPIQGGKLNANPQSSPRVVPILMLKSLLLQNKHIFSYSSGKFLLLGALIRILPAAFTAHPTDIVSWMTIGSAVFHGQNPYALQSFGLVYPPLWGFLCGIAYGSFELTQNPFVFNFVIKLPIILADLLLAKHLGNFVLERTKDERKAKQAMMLYLFNPMTIILSGIWGMFDAIPVFLVLLSTVLLLKRQYFKSSIAFGVAIAFKGFYPAMLLPLFVYTIDKNEGRTPKAIVFSVVALLVPFVISLPYLITDAQSFLNMTLLHFGQRQLSNLTYWFALRLAFWQYQDLISIIALTVFLVSFSLVYLYLLKKSDRKSLMLLIVQIILSFFLFSPTVNEQYVVWLLVPLIIVVSIGNQKLGVFLHGISVVTLVFILANTGPGFLAPLNFDLGPIQTLWSITPILVVCGLLFSVISILAFRKTIKGDEIMIGEMSRSR